MKKSLALIGIAVLAVVTAGCNDRSPAGFAGSWVEQNAKTKQPRSLEIRVDQGVYHVDERFSVGGNYKVVRDVAKVEAGNVLSIKNGFRTLKLEHGVLYYRALSFVRVP